MKQYRKLLAFIMTICLIISVAPVFASATENIESYDVPMGIGLDAIQNRNSIVFAGTEWLVLDSVARTSGEPGVAVISKDLVASNIAFNEGGLDNAWVNSDAKVWLAEYAASNFTDAELSLIADTTKAEGAGEYFGSAWSKDALSGEKLFFLSAAELDQYFVQGSSSGLIASYDGAADGWWLRSAYTDRDIMAGIVSDAGYVGYPHVAATWAARPAFNFAAESVILSSAAVGGKISGETGENSLTEIAASSSPSIKLTFADEAHNNFTATIGDGSGVINQTIGYDSWVIPVEYSGAVAADNEYVSMLICDQTGKSVYYGHIAGSTASGSVNVVMPEGLSGKYTIHVFAEQCNGDNASDFASALVTAKVVISDNMSSVANWGLALEGDIRADFYMSFEESVLSDENAYVVVTVNGNSVSHKISELSVKNDLYVVTTNVAAPQMTDIISIQAFANDTAGSEYKYSIRMYGNYILENNDDDSVKNLVKAMLNYGGKSQEYFGYNIENKADNGINIVKVDIPKYDNLAAQKSGSSSKVTYYGASLIHEHQTGIRFYFTSTDENVQSVSFNAEFADGSTIENMDVYKLDGRYYVEISDIAPNKLCNEITITVDGLSVTYGPFYYIHRMYYKAGSTAQMREMMAAMYNYYHYAAIYLDAQA